MAFNSVSSGAVLSGSTINSGDYLFVESGGAASSIVDGGFLQILKGGTASGITVEYGGYDQVLGGVESAATVQADGFLEVSSGGTANNDSIQGGGYAIVYSGGSLLRPVIAADTSVQVYSGAAIVSPVLLRGAQVDLGGVAYASGGSATLDSTTDILTIVEGGTTTSLQLAGSYTGETFLLNSDGFGLTFGSGAPGTILSVACYCAGTMILTAHGERPIEGLAIGDVAVTCSGEHRPIKWIGHRSYAGRFLAANANVQPIRFHAGSLGNGLPRRDLLVSPDHAMFHDGLLIPSRCLVNGSTIIQDRFERVDYYHVELDSHDVLLAEGAPSESFLDDDSRGMFHNAYEFAALYSDSARPQGFCALRVEHGAELEAIRVRLAAIAEAAAAA